MNGQREDLIRMLQEKATTVRKHIVRMIAGAGSGHIAPALSCADIVVALYFDVLRLDPRNPQWEDRDRFIMSKGHGCAAHYAVLAEKGFFPLEVLETFCRLDSILGGHPDRRKVPGVEASTGSLGHGLSMGVGMAIAGKVDRRGYRVVVLLGDGETNEGAVWEAAMAACHFKLDNVIAIVDRNRLQVDGWTDEVMNPEPLADKWRSFGWRVQEINGHDMAHILDALHVATAATERPSVIIANTTKGKGVSFMEGSVDWHYGTVTADAAARALQELESADRGER
jgi:transketolase